MQRCRNKAKASAYQDAPSRWDPGRALCAQLTRPAHSTTPSELAMFPCSGRKYCKHTCRHFCNTRNEEGRFRNFPHGITKRDKQVTNRLKSNREFTPWLVFGEGVGGVDGYKIQPQIRFERDGHLDPASQHIYVYYIIFNNNFTETVLVTIAKTTVSKTHRIKKSSESTKTCRSEVGCHLTSRITHSGIFNLRRLKNIKI